MNEEQKNLESVKGMTRWQRMRFEMLVSASGAFIRALTYVIFIAMFLMLATRMQSQTWYNWKNDERVNELRTNLEFMQSKVEVMQGRIDFLEGNARIRPANAWQFPMDAHPSLDGGTIAVKRTMDGGTSPYKAMRHYWREEEHPPTEENTTFLSDEMFDKLSNWMWKHHPVKDFLVLLGILLVFVIVVFEGPSALWKMLFGKTKNKKRDDNEPSDYEPTTVPLLDRLKEVKEEVRTFNPPEIDEPKKD